MRFFYSLLLYLLWPLVFVYFFWRGLREPVYFRHWHQRFGLGRDRKTGNLWLHAASVGEVQAAVPLIHALQARYPERPITLTCFTPTGVAHAQNSFGASLDCRLLPFDLPGSMHRFVRKQRAALLVIIETEIWPNLLAACDRAQLPVVFANARLKEKTTRRYARWPAAGLIGEALARARCIAAASEVDVARFARLGVAQECIHLTGNLKFDFRIPQAARQAGDEFRAAWNGEQRRVWVAGSTHEGEERLILDAYEQLLEQHPALLLVLVPRHPARFNEVADLCRQREHRTARRSEGHAVTRSTRILLGDTLGELTSFYAAADLAFVGGTLVPGVGGHNLLEPAALEVPVIVGEHLGDWVQAAQWLEEQGALIRCADADGIASAMQEALADEAGRKQAGKAARAVVANRGGAVGKTLVLIAPLV